MFIGLFLTSDSNIDNNYTFMVPATLKANFMAFSFLFLGLMVIFLSWRFANDWASGVAGFIYGGTLFWVIRFVVHIFLKFF